MYIDGELVGENEIGGRIVLPTTEASIGGPSSGDLGPPMAAIDEVAIFNRALSAVEIQSIFDAGTAGMCNAPEDRFLRGDCNADGDVNVSDADCTLNWLFAAKQEPGCLAALDTNGDEGVNITDPVSLLGFLFGGGVAPVAPYPVCGLATDATLGCMNPPDC